MKCWQALGNHYTLPLTGNVEFWCLVFGTMTVKTAAMMILDPLLSVSQASLTLESPHHVVPK